MSETRQTENPLPALHSLQTLAWGRWFWFTVAAISFILLTIWALVPWQWSSVDDPGQALAMRELIASNGPVWAILERVGQLALGDYNGGVFRPIAWIYPPLLYWMPVGPAHVVRLIMVMLIIIGPLAYFRRSGATPARLIVTLFILLIAAGSLYQGLILLSVQEVGGMALISLGLLFRRSTPRLIAWILAAWFKGPFVWILFGYAFVLWRDGRKKLALTSGVVGLFTLAINVWWSTNGTYTSRYQINPLDPELWNSASRLLEPFNGAILLAVLWWIVVTQTGPRIRPDFPIFAVAAVGYYLQMVPWGFTAYYMGPISFFLGLLLVSLLSDPPRELPLWRVLTALAVPLLLATWILKGSMTWVFQTNEILRQASQCLAEYPESSTRVVGDWLYLTTSDEGPFRLGQNIQFFDPEWTGEIFLDMSVGHEQSDPKTGLVLVVNGAQYDLEGGGSVVCDLSLVKLVQLG